MNVSFYLSGAKHEMNTKNALEPNPGLGGTQFMVWYICYLLSLQEDIKVSLYTRQKDVDIPFVKTYHVINFEDFLSQCKNRNTDICVFVGHHINVKEIDLIDKYEIKSVVWSHTFETYKQINKYSKSKYIIRNVCVSKQQMLRIQDHKIFNKSTYIYNTVNPGNYSDFITNHKDTTKTITYLGNLYPNSGIEQLAKIWKKIERKSKSVKLVIIGGNELYNMKYKFTKLEKKKFDRLIQNSFYDKKGFLKNNVEITGVLKGYDKIKKMSQSTIGIANITPTGETFGIAAIEFQLLNVPVFSIKKLGLNDTVDDKKTGFLYKNYNKLAKKIIDFLNDRAYEKNKPNGYDFISTKFNPKDMTEQWVNLLYNIYENKKIYRNEHSYENFKLLKKIYYICRLKVRIIPPYIFFGYFAFKVKRVLQKYSPI